MLLNYICQQFINPTSAIILDKERGRDNIDKIKDI